MNAALNPGASKTQIPAMTRVNSRGGDFEVISAFVPAPDAP